MKRDPLEGLVLKPESLFDKDVPKCERPEQCEHFEPQRIHGSGVRGVFGGYRVPAKCALDFGYFDRCGEGCPRAEPKAELERRIKELDAEATEIRKSSLKRLTEIDEKTSAMRRMLGHLKKREESRGPG